MYNNPKNNPIGGQGRYTYVELVDKSTNSVSYVYYGSDNTWHYSAIKPSKDGKTLHQSVWCGRPSNIGVVKNRSNIFVVCYNF